jgi:hypothetical protein
LGAHLVPGPAPIIIMEIRALPILDKPPSATLSGLIHFVDHDILSNQVGKPQFSRARTEYRAAVLCLVIRRDLEDATSENHRQRAIKWYFPLSTGAIIVRRAFGKKEGLMPVFISHKSSDKTAAKEIYNYLSAKKVSCYIDSLDPELQKTDDITAVLIRRVNQCTHIMAVVSQYTQVSWWVPFEIGVASQSDRRISTYKLSNAILPGFLSKWPILNSRTDLEMFILKYKQDTVVPISEGRAYTASIKSSDEFHKGLKLSIGQR